MPIRSSGDVPIGTVGDLGLPGRAVTALTRAGITRVEDLAVLTRRELAAIDGLGTGMIAAIRLVVPEPPPSGPREEEAPAAPPIPSFASLRDPRRRTPVDVLVPEAPPAPADTNPAPAAAPRPAEYGDLLRLGARGARAAVAAPWRLARWTAGQPVRCLRRLSGA